MVDCISRFLSIEPVLCYSEGHLYVSIAAVLVSYRHHVLLVLKENALGTSQRLALDLMVLKALNAQAEAWIKAALMLLICFNRSLYIEPVLSFSEDHLNDRIAAVLVSHRLHSCGILMDRQSVFATSVFRSKLIGEFILDLKLVLKDRHELLNTLFSEALMTYGSCHDVVFVLLVPCCSASCVHQE